MGHARNVINILTSDVVVVCGMGPGTASEAAIALKTGKPVIFTKVTRLQYDFFLEQSADHCLLAQTVDEVISACKKILNP